MVYHLALIEFGKANFEKPVADKCLSLFIMMLIRYDTFGSFLTCQDM